MAAFDPILFAKIDQSCPSLLSQKPSSSIQTARASLWAEWACGKAGPFENPVPHTALSVSPFATITARGPQGVRWYGRDATLRAHSPPYITTIEIVSLRTRWQADFTVRIRNPATQEIAVCLLTRRSDGLFEFKQVATVSASFTLGYSE